MDVLHSVDFDVMILLASIMVINHLVVHLKETKDVIDYMQQLVQSDPNRGLWVISFAAFIASPFLTNDGVCLLFVEPILNAFEYAPFAAELAEEPVSDDAKKKVLRKEDAIYFLLALACSANIGSALTYTGNPQNMIVASDSIEVLPSYKFLVYMLPATVFSWLISKFSLFDLDFSACSSNNKSSYFCVYSDGVHQALLDALQTSNTCTHCEVKEPIHQRDAQAARFWHSLASGLQLPHSPHLWSISLPPEFRRTSLRPHSCG